MTAHPMSLEGLDARMAQLEALHQIEALHQHEIPGMPGAARTSIAPAPDYTTEALPDPDPCGCEEAEALRERLARAEARARAWHRVARLKHRLLHERDAVGPASRGVP